MNRTYLLFIALGCCTYLLAKMPTSTQQSPLAQDEKNTVAQSTQVQAQFKDSLSRAKQKIESAAKEYDNANIHTTTQELKRTCVTLQEAIKMIQDQ